MRASALLTFLFIVAPPLSLAQEEIPVRDLTGRSLTAEEIVEALRPGVEPPEDLRPRGASKGIARAPNCSFFRGRSAGTRSGGPIANIAAVSILFATNSSALTAEAETNLDALGKALSTPPLSLCCIRIEGHTDSVGTEAYNLGLSQRRAEAVLAYLNRRFPIQPASLLAVGLGESQPLASNDDEPGRQKNRRVQVANLGYGDLDP